MVSAADESLGRYQILRMRAAQRSTGDLRRIERAFRRVATGPNRSALDRHSLRAWMAVRAELRNRGRHVAESDVRPRRRPRLLGWLR